MAADNDKDFGTDKDLYPHHEVADKPELSEADDAGAFPDDDAEDDGDDSIENGGLMNKGH
jgi:hypothetical protein